MKISSTLIWLACLIILLAAVSAGIGAFWDDAGKPFSVTTPHGETVKLYGHGLYRYDSELIADGFRNQDKIILVLGIPLLIVSIALYRRGSLPGGLLLTGTLAYFFYDYLSMAFGAAYNNLLLIYIALFTVSLFALILAITSFDLPAFPSHFTDRLPRRGIAIFLIAIGIAFYIIWAGLSIIPTILAGQVPAELAHYTTVITFVVDLGMIAPAMIVAGGLLLRRTPTGYLLATVLLIFTLIINIQLGVMGLMQYLAGLMTIGQFIGMSLSFDLIALIAIGFTVSLFRNFKALNAIRT
jgi:hypothetical protein